MREEIILNLDNPRQLEKLYREHTKMFKREFNRLFPEIQDHPVAQIWNERLNFEQEEISWGAKNELTFVILACLVAAVVVKIPSFTSINEDFFYMRNTGFVVFPFLTAYFAWRQSLPLKKVLLIAGLLLCSLIYINCLPQNPKSDTLVLACIHLPLFLWMILGFSFVGSAGNIYPKRLDFLRYNGDLLVMTTIILLAGALMTVATLGLFGLINVNIETFYVRYIVVSGLAAAPIVGTYLVQTNPQLVHKVSPVIAKVFTPLVLLTLVIYLGVVIGTGKDPYNDRDFLLVFNMLLVGVMSLILFSIAETSTESRNKLGAWLLLALALVTVVINGIALSAIVFRISAWGISPNRLAVLGGNLLILTHLLLVTYRLFTTIKDPNQEDSVGRSIVAFLPVYCIWVAVVSFLFPLLFRFA